MKLVRAHQGVECNGVLISLAYESLQSILKRSDLAYRCEYILLVARLPEFSSCVVHSTEKFLSRGGKFLFDCSNFGSFRFARLSLPNSAVQLLKSRACFADILNSCTILLSETLFTR